MTDLDEHIRHELERLRPSTDGLDSTLRLVRRRRRNRRIAGGGLGLLLTLALVAGLFAIPGRNPAPATIPSASRTPVTPTPIAPTPGPSGSGTDSAYVATCSASVYGKLPRHWKRDSVIVGPLAFAGLRVAATEPRSDISSAGIGWKVVTVVAPGRRVAVRVPASEAGRVALIYAPGAFRDNGRYTLADGERSVTFEACPPGGSPYRAFGAHGGTQFAGGFIINGPTCVSLDVRPEGGRRTRVRIPLGAGTCG